MNESPKVSLTPSRRVGLSRKSTFQSPLLIKSTNLSTTGGASTPTLKRGLSRNVGLSECKSPKVLRFIDFQDTTVKTNETNNDADLVNINNSSSTELCLNNFPNSAETTDEATSDCDLINLIDTWKGACKEALLYLQSWIKEHENVNLSNRQLAKRLGICQVIDDYFASDTEVVGSEEESEGQFEYC